jgi:hypothetical protein
MEDEVKDGVLTGQIDDLILAILLEVTVSSIVTDRPLFSNPLYEPDFYRKRFKRWVEEGLAERRNADKKPGDGV